MHVGFLLSPFSVSASFAFPSSKSSLSNHCVPPGVTHVTMETTLELYVKVFLSGCVWLSFTVFRAIKVALHAYKPLCNVSSSVHHPSSLFSEHDLKSIENSGSRWTQRAWMCWHCNQNTEHPCCCGALLYGPNDGCYHTFWELKSRWKAITSLFKDPSCDCECTLLASPYHSEG